MKNRKLVGILLGLLGILAVVVLIIPGCSTSTTSTSTAPAKVYEIKYCVQDSAQDVRVSVIAEAEKKWLYEKSGGRIVVNIIPNSGAVTSAADIFDAVRTGVIEMGIQSSSRVAGRFNLMEVLSLPGIAHYPSCMETTMVARELYQKYPEIQKEFAGVKVLGFNSVSSTQLYTRNKQIKTLDDMKGAITRAGGEYALKAVDALGASPINLPPSEWADAAIKGVYDVQVLNFMALYALNLQDIFNYVTDYNIQHSYFVQVLNEDFYNSLPADLQELFSWDNWEDDAMIYGGLGNQTEMEYKAKFEEKLKTQGLPGIYKLPADEAAKWDVKMQTVRDAWVANTSAKGPSAQILSDYLELSKKYSYTNYNPESWKSILDEWSSYPAVP